MRRSQSLPWPTAHFAFASFSKTSYTLEPLAAIADLFLIKPWRIKENQLHYIISIVITLKHKCSF
ncbi:MAG: hypothetical protein ACFFC1_07555 [Promethearchaeota archaeon]